MDINWESIEGYTEELSAEEKLALLANYTPEPPAEPTGKVVKKDQFDKVASELAAMKKKLRDQMTEEEAKELERQQAQESIQQELEALRKDKTTSEYKSKCLALGFDEQMAATSADALADGNINAMLEDLKKHTANLEKNLRAQILKETPKPPAGDDPADPEPKNARESVFQKTSQLLKG